MATRQPRRTRRRTVPAASLPRPVPTEEGAATTPRSGTRSLGGHRTHHVTTDYHYVKKDLYTILGVGTVAMAFIVGMAFYIG